MPKRLDGWVISTGFLTGNLGLSSEFDEEQSVRGYKRALEDALAKAFPGAEIEVGYEWASGCVPYGLTSKAFSPGSDEGLWKEEEAVAEEVERISEEVYGDFAWVVEKDEPE